MDATRDRQRLIPSVAALRAQWAGVSRHRRFVVPIELLAGSITGAVAALAFLIMPIDVLESMSVDSGIAALVAAAEPPLGLTARLAVAFFAALGVGGVTWFAVTLLVGARSLIVNRGVRADGMPAFRRADAHPDAPPRQPVFANRDLGTPFLDVTAEARPMTLAEAMAIEPEFESDPAERALPADLDTPLASYLNPLDPPLPEPAPLPIVLEPEPVNSAPIDVVPEPVEPVAIEPEPQPVAEVTPEPAPEPAPEPIVTLVEAPAAPRFAPNERIETIELTPTVRATASIHDLLDRLEKGVARKQPAPEPVAEDVPAEKSLEDTLDALRALARRVG